MKWILATLLAMSVFNVQAEPAEDTCWITNPRDSTVNYICGSELDYATPLVSLGTDGYVYVGLYVWDIDGMFHLGNKKNPEILKVDAFKVNEKWVRMEMAKGTKNSKLFYPSSNAGIKHFLSQLRDEKTVTIKGFEEDLIINATGFKQALTKLFTQRPL